MPHELEHGFRRSGTHHHPVERHRERSGQQRWLIHDADREHVGVHHRGVAQHKASERDVEDRGREKSREPFRLLSEPDDRQGPEDRINQRGEGRASNEQV